MFTTESLFRILKIMCVAAIGLMGLLIVIGNTTDYYSNYYFVEHVMKMDTIFPDSQIHYRSVQQPWVYHTGYILLIALEALMSFCCIRGAWQMKINFRGNAAVFHQSKKWAVAGIGIGILIWFAGFEVIGGEWFGMWQSKQFNGLGAADRILIFLTLTLILLHLKEAESA
jgi:predicted small integral membrane protein